MARSFASLSLASSLLLNSLTRRGYAKTSQGVRAGGGSLSGKMGKKTGEEKMKEKVSWVPDPVTGYYKPENSKDIDVADLRATLLGKKITN